MKRKNKKSNWKALLLSLTRLELSLSLFELFLFKSFFFSDFDPLLCLLLLHPQFLLHLLSLHPLIPSVSSPGIFRLKRETNTPETSSRVLFPFRRFRLLPFWRRGRSYQWKLQSRRRTVSTVCTIERERESLSFNPLSVSFSVVSLASLF